MSCVVISLEGSICIAMAILSVLTAETANDAIGRKNSFRAFRKAVAGSYQCRMSASARGTGVRASQCQGRAIHQLLVQWLVESCRGCEIEFQVIDR